MGLINPRSWVRPPPRVLFFFNPGCYQARSARLHLTTTPPCHLGHIFSSGRAHLPANRRDSARRSLPRRGWRPGARSECRAAEGQEGQGRGWMEKYHPSPARVVSLPTPFITRTLTRTLTLGAGRAPLPLPHPYLGVGEFSVFRRIRTRYFLGGGSMEGCAARRRLQRACTRSSLSDSPTRSGRHP